MKVRIKTLEQMIREYGPLDTAGNISPDRIKCGYASSMEKSMPRDRIIEVTKWEAGLLKWKGVGWSISEDMIAEIIDEKKDIWKYAIQQQPIAPEIFRMCSDTSGTHMSKSRIKKRSYVLNY